MLLLDAQNEVASGLTSTRPDFVFNIAEGTSGVDREAEVPRLLESLGIPYTGSGPETLSLCLDKARTKKTLQTLGIPTPRFTLFDFSPGSPEQPSFPCFPAIVKPCWEGSSKGILNSSLVRDQYELSREVSRIGTNYRQPAIVEDFLPGREFTAALLGNGDELEVLPIVEIALDCLPAEAPQIYSYEAKWLWDKPENPLPILRCPAEIPIETAQQIKTLALKTFKALECRDWCRIDFRADATGKIHVLEVNPLPGILPEPKENSCFPLAARTAGIAYDDLILNILNTACRRIESTRYSERTASPRFGG